MILKVINLYLFLYNQNIIIKCFKKIYFLWHDNTLQIQVGLSYPHEAPKVKCETMVYHPNIDLEGNVCLNILREDWKPVLTINAVVYGLQYLFLVCKF